VLLTAHTAALAPEVDGVLYVPRGRRTLRNVREPIELFAAVRTGESTESDLPATPSAAWPSIPNAPPGG
jgi:hypothetical protein